MPMNRRQVIEAARDHLLKQGSWAIDPETPHLVSQSPCRYLAPDGTRCAIGGLPGFPENLDKSNMSAGQLFASREEFKVLFAEDVDAEFLNIVQQRLHDALADPRPNDGKIEFRPFDQKEINEVVLNLISRYC